MSLQLQHEAFCLDSMSQQLFFFDDFLGDQIQDEWTVGTWGGSSAIVDGETGGVYRLTTQNVSGHDTYIHMLAYRVFLVSKSVTGEVRIKAGAITKQQIAFYLYYSSSEQLWSYYNEIAGGAINYSEACYAAGDSQVYNSGIVATTNYIILRMAASPVVAPHAHFYYDGVEGANSPISDHITASYLCPYLTVVAREAVAKTLDVDYVGVRQLT